MSELKDNQIHRGLNQALYKYLPDSWVDFYMNKLRTGYTAKVKIWHSMKLDDINEDRVLDTIAHEVESFINSSPDSQAKGFGPSINPNTYDILIPKCGVNTDIFVEISPLVFFCVNCKRIHSFTSSDFFLRNPKNRKCTLCGSNLNQIQMTYACKCGWAGPIKVKPCKNREHGFKYIKRGYNSKGFIVFYCEKCGMQMELTETCPECNAKLFPRNALDLGQFIPATKNMIDLVNIGHERFLAREKFAPYLVVANWLDIITRMEFDDYVRNGVRLISDEEREEKIIERTKALSKVGVPVEYARTAAEASINEEFNNDKINEILSIINSKLFKLEGKFLNTIALSILEYHTILYPVNNNISTLDDAISMSLKLNTNANPQKYKEIAQKYGIHYTQVSGSVPFITASYGYTRREKKGVGVNLRAFPQERSEKKNIYASKLETEGVLFEIDRVKIIKWLEKNGFITKEQMPEIGDEMDVKTWFINNIELGGINTFNEIDKETYPITSYVYTLIHSIAHALIVQASHLCGLDKNSLSEYIFPNTPAVFIYCQNSQGFNLGALFNIFEAYFDKWIMSAAKESEKCIFDPICIDNEKACAGCLFLNEISCCHFNKDLNRSYLIGHFDKISKKRMYGFWEE